MIAALAVAIPLLAQAPEMTLGREASIGEAIARELHKASPPLDNAEVQNYANTVGQRLVAALPASDRLAYKFEVVDTRFTDPIPLPGGYVLIPATSFITSKDASEFAARLAHAIAHIELRHFDNPAADGRVQMILPVHPDPSSSGVAVPIGRRERLAQMEVEANAFALPLAPRAGLPDSSADFERVRAIVIEQQSKRRAAPTLHKQ